jgi:ribonuclease BN (tRNA processing enzyme)
MPPPKVLAYGVRGSIPAAGREFARFGGDTASFVVVTPEGSRVFLDAGTGILRAAVAHVPSPRKAGGAPRLFLLLSHSHADHVYGLGMSALRWHCLEERGRGMRLDILGPPGISRGLDQFYDGARNWPLSIGSGSAKTGSMPCVDRSLIREVGAGDEVRVDGSTSIRVMLGSHPVEGGVAIYRIEMESRGSKRSVVYATDNEFDFLPGGAPNPRADRLKTEYVDFTGGSDLLLADAQYTRAEYFGGGAGDRRGFGHAFLEQVVEIAASAEVRKLIIIHHGRHSDAHLASRERAARALASRLGSRMKVAFARQGESYPLG